MPPAGLGARERKTGLIRLAKNGLVTIVTRAFESFEKKSCGICDNDFSALPENISQGLVAIVTRDFQRFEKKILWHL